MVEVSAEVLASIAGTLISIVLFIVPFLSRRFYELSDDTKQAINLSTILVVSISLMASSCAGYLEINFTCDNTGLIEYVKVIGAALMGNTTMFVSFRRLAQRTYEAKYS